MRIAAIQSNYIPWKGYFDLINEVDEFVFLDEVQYTRRDWRNRNKVKVGGALRWLTIPVEVKGRYDQRIDETRIADHSWPDQHFATLAHAYRRAAHFDETVALLEPLYRRHAATELLTQVNTGFVAEICRHLGIGTKLSRSTDYPTGDRVSWADYSGYPEYTQLGGPFEHGVSIVDLLFNTGPAAREHMKSFGGTRHAVG
jgi:hypothetical protein